MLTGSGCSDEAKRTSSAERPASSVPSDASVISSGSGTGWNASADSLVVSVTFSGALDFRQPPPRSGNKIKADPILHQGTRLFIAAIKEKCFIASLALIESTQFGENLFTRPTPVENRKRHKFCNTL